MIHNYLKAAGEDFREKMCVKVLKEGKEVGFLRLRD